MHPNKMVGNKRGRKAIPPQWSRIIELDEYDSSTIKVYEIEEDMARAE